jgi:pyridoxal phosphate enzyme (YggS family)
VLLSRHIFKSFATMAVDKPVAKALEVVTSRVRAASAKVNRAPPRLVAVSKTKPVEAIQEAYEAGHRIFGENYVQEMLEKAPVLPSDISWHFIGHLQSNKVKSIIESVPNLTMVETVDSTKLADKLNKAVEATGRPPLPVMVQVNTSGEESKHGVGPSEVVPLARHVFTQCSHLKLAGLMTIGMPDYTSTPENFECLSKCKEEVALDLSLSVDQLELSMGMSGDFEQAIQMGSTNIRVGSTIFGARDYNK